MNTVLSPVHTHEQVIEAEVAIEILNRARALLSARIYEIETTHPSEADRLRAKRKDLHEILSGIKVGDDRTVRALTEHWGRLMKDEAAFWAVMNG